MDTAAQNLGVARYISDDFSQRSPAAACMEARAKPSNAGRSRQLLQQQFPQHGPASQLHEQEGHSQQQASVVNSMIMGPPHA